MNIFCNTINVISFACWSVFYLGKGNKYFERKIHIFLFEILFEISFNMYMYQRIRFFVNHSHAVV